jgi:nucleoside 2-deoxyribosyltransferase
MRALAIMPFSKDFNEVFESMKRACEKCMVLAPDSGGEEDGQSASSVVCERMDQRMGPSFDIVKELLKAIKTCTFCICDLTGGNQNVLWEVGFAMALEKPVILLTQDIAKLGFDLRGRKFIQYDRNNLTDSLEERLVSEITEIIANPANGPAFSLHSKALAMSSGSPTYFLDNDYRIHYMNEAAADLFATTRYGVSKSWIGRNLREFINDIYENVENLAAAEKNLQVQTEDIHRLRAEGNEKMIPTCNIEPIIFNSPDYGKLALQKTGVAVRDPSTNDVTGWVVSFNVVKAHEPEKYERFHDYHRTQIQALLLRKEQTCSSGASRIIQHSDFCMEWSKSRQVEAWVRDGCESPKLTVADSYGHKQRCFDFCASVMICDPRRYGLQSVRHLDEWYFDFTNAEYVLMWTPEDDLVGVCRIHMNHLLNYEGLDQWVTNAVENGQRFADIGAYLHPLIEGRSRTICVARLLGKAARIAVRHDQVHLYAQVPSYLDKVFETFLFRKAGKKFKCWGWCQPSWVPIASKCIVYSDDGESTDLHQPENVDKEFISAARREYRKELEEEQKVI